MHKNFNLLTAIFFSVYGLILRIQGLIGRDLWVDEMVVYKAAVGPFRPFWQRLNYGEAIYFPGQYLVAWPFVHFFDKNKWGLAIPHYISAILGFYLLYLLCNKYFKSSLAWTIAFAMMCFNRELVSHALEFRWYAVLPTLSLASFYLTEKLVWEYPKMGMAQKILTFALFIFIVIYHVYGAFIILFPFLFHLSIRLRKSSVAAVAQEILPFWIPFGIIGSGLFLWYFSGPNGIGFTENFPRETFQFIPNPLINGVGFFKGIVGNLLGNKLFYLTLIAVPIAFLYPHPDRNKKIMFFLFLIVFPIELIFLSDVFKEYWFLQRQFIWVTPLFIFFISWCWDNLPPQLFARRIKS